MFDYKPANGVSKTQLYEDLCGAADALTRDESDGIANMANVAALIADFLPALNWAGFYRAIGDELVLGPFIGRPACIRIPWGQGVCGAAAQSAQTQLVPDVHAFAGHIACDALTRSELVIPLLQGGRVVAVLDLDSPEPARFDAQDASGMERLGRSIADRI